MKWKGLGSLTLPRSSSQWLTTCIQTGEPLPHLLVPPSLGKWNASPLPCTKKFITCLLSYKHLFCAHEISPVFLSERSIRICYSSIWAQPRSLRVQQVHRALSPLRHKGLRIFAYLDDYLLCAQSRSGTQRCSRLI